MGGALRRYTGSENPPAKSMGSGIVLMLKPIKK